MYLIEVMSIGGSGSQKMLRSNFNLVVKVVFDGISKQKHSLSIVMFQMEKMVTFVHQI